MSLTPNQQAALVAEGNVLVTAAAGSGKTHVLTSRILRAVLDQGADIRSIVAVTFTDRAAQEIRMRVGAGLEAAQQFDMLAALDHAPIGTIHSVCRRIVGAYGSVVGVDPGVRLLDATTSSWALRQSIRTAAAALTRSDERVARLRSRWGDHRVERVITAAYHAAQQRLDGRVRFVGDIPEVIAHERSDLEALDCIVQEALARYQQECRAHGGVDFDQIQRLAMRVLAHDDIRVAVRADVSRLLVDEFQDTNAVQCAILDAIGDGCMFAVGDECQSIYRFRAADVAVFRARRASGDQLVLSMPENFRSHQRVIDVVNGMFDVAFDDEYVPVIAAGSHADAEEDMPGCELVVAMAPSVEAARHIEASHVARRVVELIDNGVAPGDIALLFPRSSQAGIYVAALQACGVPTVRSSSRGYHQQDAVRDLVNILAWINNPADDRSTLGVLASPLVRMRPGDMLRVRRSVEPTASIWSAVVRRSADPIDGCDTAQLAHVVGLHADLARRASRDSLVNVVDHVIHHTGLAEHALAGPDGTRAYANLRRLIELAAAAHTNGIRHVSEFVDLLRIQTQLNSEGEANIAEEGTNAVRILTVHASKGLEFPYVFVCDLSNSKPSAYDVLVDDDGRAWVKLFDADGIEQRTPPEYDEVRARELAAEAAEERRLLYVAMTRAERGLWMSAGLGTTSTGKPSLRGPIRWMADAVGMDIGSHSTPRMHPDFPLYMRVEREACGVREIAHPVIDVSEGPMVHQVVIDPMVDGREPVLSDGDSEDTQVGGMTPERRHQLSRGEQLHAAIAACLLGTDIASWNLPDDVVDQVERVRSGACFADLVAAGGRPEVTWHAMIDGTMHTGRFDAVAIQGRDWWIVDWKHSLPGSESAAWDLHGEQFGRYMDAALLAGAETVRLTVVSMNNPNHMFAWSRSANR